MSAFTPANVTTWMKRNYLDHIDDCNELNTTSLAESAADHFNESDSPGPLDDDTHWIWECSRSVSEGI